MSISEGSEYLASLRSAGVSDATAQLLYANLVLQGQDPATTRPTNVQDSWNHQIGLTYMYPLSEKLLAMPNFIFSKSVYTEGRYTGREDINTSFGLNFSFSWIGAALACSIMSFPLLVRPIRVLIEAQDNQLEFAAKTLGSSNIKIFFTDRFFFDIFNSLF